MIRGWYRAKDFNCLVERASDVVGFGSGSFSLFRGLEVVECEVLCGGNMDVAS